MKNCKTFSCKTRAQSWLPISKHVSSTSYQHFVTLFFSDAALFFICLIFVCTQGSSALTQKHTLGPNFFFFFFFFAVPSTVPTSEALLPRRSSRHPSPPATPRAHSASRPRPQRSTGSDVRSLVGCHPKETLHCC